MSILDWFNKKEKPEQGIKKLDIPGDLWVKCYSCNSVLYLKDLVANSKVCLECQYHFRITPQERISYIFDHGSFTQNENQLKSIEIS